MLSQLVALQLTDGCNGNCPFCLFGKKKGVEGKYFFESIATFFKKYKQFLPKSINLYWDSDPFDWRDENHGFLDIYKAWRDIRPMEYSFISTSIPRGSEKDFLNFMKYAIAEYYRKHFYNLILLPPPALKIRISLAKHNISRVESVFKKLTEELLKDGNSEKEINDFYASCIEIGERFESLVKIGPLIGEHDDIKDVFTPACQDGIIINPRSVKAIMITNPTIYEPSGEKDIDLTPARVKNNISLNVYIDDYASFFHPLSEKIKSGRVMLDYIKTIDGNEYNLDDSVEDSILKLGREAASIGRLINDLSGLSLLVENQKGEKEKYLIAVFNVFKERRLRTIDQVKKTEHLILRERLTSDQKEKLQFYNLLAKTFLAKMDFLASQIEEGLPIQIISASATLLRNVGRNEVKKLPKIIYDLEKIDKFLKKVAREKSKGKFRFTGIGQELEESIRLKLTNIFIEAWGFDGKELPSWYKIFEDRYVDSLGTDLKQRKISGQEGKEPWQDDYFGLLRRIRNFIQEFIKTKAIRET